MEMTDTMATAKKLKLGTKVEVRRVNRWPNGKTSTYFTPGRIAGSDEKKNGLWYSVNLAAKGWNAKLINVRASQIAVV